MEHHSSIFGGIVNINLDNVTGNVVTVSIYNELGEVIYHYEITDNNPEGYQQIEADLQEFTNGIYLVKIVSDNVTHTEKLILQGR